MAFQVGAFCYADAAAAAAATCTRFDPITSVSGDGVVRTVSCEGVNTDNSLNLRVSLAGSGAPSISYVSQSVQFQPCQWQDVTDALGGIFGALLCMVFLGVAWWGVVRFFNWSRGDAQ